MRELIAMAMLFIVGGIVVNNVPAWLSIILWFVGIYLWQSYHEDKK